MTDVAGHRTAAAEQRGADGNALLEMHRTVWRLSAVSALVSIGCIEQLRDGPVDAAELARRCGAHAATLARVLRAAATTGLLRTAGHPGRYELTEAGQVLLGGLELERMRWSAHQEVWAALAELPETIRTGRAPFVERYGGLYGFLENRPEIAVAFDAFMVGRSNIVADALSESGTFPNSGTVVDIGGGSGTFLAAILRTRPGLRGVLLDLERVVDSARQYLAASGVAERCEVVAGDYFRDMPVGADMYLLAHIIHNWDDDGATDILRAVRSAMPDHGRLLLVEAVLPDDDRPHVGKDLDVRLLTLYEGKERSEAEYSALLASGGFRVDQVTGLAAGECLVTAVPVAPESRSGN